MSGNEEMSLHGSEATPRALEQLHAYHDGELGGVARWLFERRLRRSPELQQELEGLDQIGSLVRASETRADEVDLWDRISLRLPAADAQRAEQTETASFVTPAWLRPLGAAAVAAAALVAVFFGTLDTPAPSERVVRWMDSGGRSVMVLDDEADSDVTIIWILDGAVEGAARGGRSDVV